MSCNEGLNLRFLLKSGLLAHFQNQMTKPIQKSIGIFFNSLGMWSWLIYTTCEFIYVRYGTGYNFPHWSPTLSGLMLVLSVPVLTRSPSRLQFLLAIATRLPFWLGPADLKRRVTLFRLDQPSEYHWNFQNLLWPSGVACVLLEHTHEHVQTLTQTPAQIRHEHLQTRFYSTYLYRAALLVGDYLRRYFCRWCRFLLLVCSGRPVFSSSPRLPAPLWPDIDWHWSPLRGNRQRRSYTYWDEDKERICWNRLGQRWRKQTAQFMLTTRPRMKVYQVVPQILAIVIGGHIVDMYLVTFLEYTKQIFRVI